MKLSQSTSKSISPLALAVAMGLSASALPTVVSAGVSGSIAASNLYLFRGVNLSESAPQVSGSLDYAHDLGVYAGVWASSEGAGGEQEYDLYVGYAGEFEGFGYDINLTDYNYPSNTISGAGNSSEDIGDFSELIITLSAGPASFTYVDSLQGANSSDPDSSGGYSYYALAYDSDLFGVNLGMHDFGDATPAGEDDSMTHLDVSLYLSDEFTFTASQIIDNPETATGAEVYADDLLFVATWSKSFDL